MSTWRLSELTGRRVIDDTGRTRGRVVDVRSPGRPETQPRERPRHVDTLLYGRRGLLERLGWVEPTSEEVRWRDVDVPDARSIRIDADALRKAAKPRDDTRRYERHEARRADEVQAGKTSAREQKPAGKQAARKPAGKAAKQTGKAKPRKAHSDEPQRAQKGSSNSRERRK